MSENYNEQYINNSEITLPLIALRGMVGFPGIQMNIEIVRPISLKAFTAAATVHDAKVLLVTQRDIAVDNPGTEDFYDFGVIAEIKHVVKNPQGNLAVVFEGISRVKMTGIELNSGFYYGTAEIKRERAVKTVTTEMLALMDRLKRDMVEICQIHPSFTDELRIAAEAITDPGYFADFVASSALVDYKNKESVLEAMTARTRLEKLLVALEEEMMLIE